MARPPSPLDLSLHAHFGILAQRCRGFFRDPDKAAIETRRVPIGRRSPSRDQPLPRRVQSTVQALHMDRRSKQNRRRCQTRAPSVRFDPLACRNSMELLRRRGHRQLQCETHEPHDRSCGFPQSANFAHLSSPRKLVQILPTYQRIADLRLSSVYVSADPPGIAPPRR